MTDPSASQTVAKLAEDKGETVVAMTVLRRYWKPVSAVVAVALALGRIIQQGEDVKEKLVKIEATQTVQATQNADVDKRLTKIEADWGALFGAARITVTPNTPQPAPAPAKKREKGTR